MKYSAAILFLGLSVVAGCSEEAKEPPLYRAEPGSDRDVKPLIGSFSGQADQVPWTLTASANGKAEILKNGKAQLRGTWEKTFDGIRIQVRPQGGQGAEGEIYLRVEGSSYRVKRTALLDGVALPAVFATVKKR